MCSGIQRVENGTFKQIVWEWSDEVYCELMF